MSKFKEKVEKMKFDLANIQFAYGYYSNKAVKLREKLEIYEKVVDLSYGEVGKSLAYVAGEIEKSKSGFYCEAPVYESKKLLNVLRERIKADKKESTKNLKREHGDLVEIGCSAEDRKSGGIEIS